jgi:hypothetical protein
VSANHKKWTLPEINQNDLNWDLIPRLEIREFPWYKSGSKQRTFIQLAHSDSKIFVKILSEDSWSYACKNKLNSQVCEDSCVELFFSPRNKKGSPYFNIEVNCIGTLHFAYGAGREHRIKCSPDQAEQLKIQASLPGPLKEEMASDSQWTVELEIPIVVLSEWVGESLHLKDNWWANFYRCGGRKDPQYAVWNHIQTDEPDYHRPEQFGEIVFDTHS